MKSELLAKSPLLMLPLLALFFFIAVFAFVVVTVMRRKSYGAIAALPFEDESLSASAALEATDTKE